MTVYWVYLNDPETHTPLLLPTDSVPDGTALFSGLAHCEISTDIEYSLDILDGLTGEESMFLLDGATDNIFMWGKERSSSRTIIQKLLTWAQTYPDGIWRVE